MPWRLALKSMVFLKEINATAINSKNGSVTGVTIFGASQIISFLHIYEKASNPINENVMPGAIAMEKGIRTIAQ
jgi:hypothetical protein